MLTKKKKFIILGVMFALLIVTGYLNIVLNNATTQTSTDLVTNSNFFSTYRDDRQSTRNQEIAYYDAIIASTSTSSEARTTAEANREAIVVAMETELVLEGLIKAKGFEDAVVTTSTANINIIIKGSELTSAEVAQIVNIVSTQTGKTIDNIKIIPVE